MYFIFQFFIKFIRYIIYVENHKSKAKRIAFVQNLARWQTMRFIYKKNRREGRESACTGKSGNKDRESVGDEDCLGGVL